MSILKLSQTSAEQNLIWTWGNHNRLKSFIYNEAAKQKRTKAVFKNLQCVLDRYDNLFDKLSTIKSIDEFRTIIDQAKNIFKDKCNTLKISVYLAGAADEVNYRRSAIELYGDIFNLFNPMTENSQEADNIVDLDKQAIQKCDVFVAYIKKYTAGTCMEIEYAHSIGKPVYVIDKGNFIKDVWIYYHTTNFFPSIKTCFNYIIEEYNVGCENV